jgi:hypothetical protein
LMAVATNACWSMDFLAPLFDDQVVP